MKRILVVSLFLLAASFSAAQDNSSALEDTAPQSRAAEDRLALEKADAAVSQAAKDLKPKETRVALPPGYKQYTTGEQQDKIKAVQKEYAAVLALLEERIRLLKEERDAKILQVLPPDVQEKVGQRRKRNP